MAQHDYDIANQTAPNLRSDLNNVLDAIASTNSGTAAPSTTHANQLWYDTTNNILKMRDEADAAWISLMTLDQSGSLSYPTNIASQAEAEAGTNTTKMMTPERVAQAIAALETGASTTYGDVNTYVWASRTGTTTDVTAGSTAAGSTLVPTGATRSVSHTGASSTGSVSLGIGSVLSGTWRCMGTYDHSASSGSISGNGSTLWVRIS